MFGLIKFSTSKILKFWKSRKKFKSEKKPKIGFRFLNNPKNDWKLEKSCIFGWNDIFWAILDDFKTSWFCFSAYGRPRLKSMKNHEKSCMILKDSWRILDGFPSAKCKMTEYIPSYHSNMHTHISIQALFAYSSSV